MKLNYKRFIPTTAAIFALLFSAGKANAGFITENINPQPKVSLEQAVSETAEKEKSPTNLMPDELQFSVGYGKCHLIPPQKDLEKINFSGRIVYNISDKVRWLKGNENMFFMIEPNFSSIIRPNTSYEIGLNFEVEYRKAINHEKTIEGYIRAGLGGMHTNLKTLEQGDALNEFTPNVGVGLYIFTDKEKNNAFTIGLTQRHYSHANLGGMKNSGVDTLSIDFGCLKKLGSSKNVRYTPRVY